MKYYRLLTKSEYKGCFLENNNSFIFRKQYYNNELPVLDNPIEVSFNQSGKNKYLPLKNILTFWGMLDSFVIDEFAMNHLKNRFINDLSFIEVKVTDTNEYDNIRFYLIFFCNIISGLNKKESIIKHEATDSFVIDREIDYPSIFKFENLKTETFCDETFKAFVEENNIEGWIFREAFEK